MSRVIFNAPSQDAATPTTFYGVGHQADITDEAFVRRLQAEGKAALMGANIRNVRVISRAATTAQLGFTVDQPCTGMLARYGTTTAMSSSQAATPASGSGDIVVNLTGLTTATLYYYCISVTVGTYTTLSPTASFTTA